MTHAEAQAVQATTTPVPTTTTPPTPVPPTRLLAAAINLMWLGQGVVHAAYTQFQQYRSISHAKQKDKLEEGFILDRVTDLLASMELLMEKKYNVEHAKHHKAVFTEIGMEMRTVVAKLMDTTDPLELHKLFMILQAAALDEVRISDELLEPSTYQVPAIAGGYITLTREANGYWTCPLVVGEYKEPLYLLSVLQSKGLVKQNG